MHNLDQNGATETQRREQLGGGGVFVCVRLFVFWLMSTVILWIKTTRWTFVSGNNIKPRTEGPRTDSPPVYDQFKSKLPLRILTSWTVWRKTGDFSRSVIEGCWSQGTSQLSHVFSDATDQERRELLVVGTEGCGTTEGCGARLRLPSYFKPADLHKGEALTAG